MQNYARFDKIKPVFLNKENYTFELQKDLEVFVNSWYRCKMQLDTANRYMDDLDFIDGEIISNEITEQFEKQVSEIFIDETFSKVAFNFNLEVLSGRGYLVSIDKYSFHFWFIHKQLDYCIDEQRPLYNCSSFVVDLLFAENEIVFCMMKNLCKIVDLNKQFDQKLNEYRGMFEGSMEDFLECLITTEASFYLGNAWQHINQFPRYAALRIKLTDMMNNLQSTDQAEGKTDVIIINEVNGRDCIEFDNVFPSVKAKNEVWGYMKTLNIIDNDGNISMGTRQNYLLAFITVMRKHLFINNIADRPLSEIFNLKLTGKQTRIYRFNNDDVTNIVATLNRIEEKNAPRFTS